MRARLRGRTQVFLRAERAEALDSSLLAQAEVNLKVLRVVLLDDVIDGFFLLVRVVRYHVGLDAYGAAPHTQRKAENERKGINIKFELSL